MSDTMLLVIIVAACVVINLIAPAFYTWRRVKAGWVKGDALNPQWTKWFYWAIVLFIVEFIVWTLSTPVAFMLIPSLWMSKWFPAVGLGTGAFGFCVALSTHGYLDSSTLKP